VHKRRARLRDAASPGVTLDEWRAICAAHTDKAGRVCCAYCGRPCKATVDHVVPISRGGRDEAANVLPACKTCNSSKRDLLVTEWRRREACAKDGKSGRAPVSNR
jgi:5-methylcytosine-specific restriction endonuclease McrA